jgi:tRNA threonylcarbamoyladenosine biosynthesis protein TsaB
MLLAIDTSTAQMGLALYDGISIPGEFTWRSDLHHTQELAPALAELLRRVGIKMSAIHALGLALGPGSFTSLRVGLAFAKGLVIARHIPVVGIPTLDIVAAAIPPQEATAGLPEPVLSPRLLAALVQAGRGRLAVGWYDSKENGWQPKGPVTLTTADALLETIHKPVIVCGEMSADERHRMARKYKNVMLAPPTQCVRRPGILAELAWQKWQSGKVDNAATLAPIYLHVAGGLPV